MIDIQLQHRSFEMFEFEYLFIRTLKQIKQMEITREINVRGNEKAQKG